jgi:RNA-directed DNA polymerase
MTRSATLARHDGVAIARHVKVEGDRSFFDGDLVYWASRLGRHPELSGRKARLLRQQQGRCAWCGRLFLDVEELMEVDHVQPLHQGGKDIFSNQQLLHRHCHDSKTALDGLSRRPSSRGVPQRAVVEELGESKGSRPVLKAGREWATTPA